MADQFVVIDEDGQVLNDTDVVVIDVGIVARAWDWERETSMLSDVASDAADNYGDAILEIYELCKEHGYQEGVDLAHDWLVKHSLESRTVKVSVEAPKYEEEW